MTGHRRWTPRRLAGMATIGTVILVTGILTGTGSAIGQQNADRHFSYTCHFPSGAQSVDLDIAVTFPSSGTVGQAIRPADGTVTIALPHAALRDLTKLDAATVSGIAQFHTTVTQNGRAENATWADLVAAPKPVPATGDLVLTAATEAPAITPKAPGDITFAAAALTLVLTPEKADGTGTNPAALPLGCTLGAGRHALLASVPVPAATATPGPRSSRPPAVSPVPAAGRSVRPHDTTATPADCGTIPDIYPQDTLGLGLCGFLTGFANVDKLNAATPIAPHGGFFNAFGPYAVALQCEPDTTAANAGVCLQEGDVVHTFDCSFAQFEDNGTRFELPPTRATFLAFGFMPVTATMHLTEAPWPADHPPAISPLCTTGFFSGVLFPFTFPKRAVTITSDSVNNFANGVFTVTLNTTLETFLSVRISDATVNGVPLDVGPNCRTSQPVHSLTVASGAVVNGLPTGYSFVSGGPITGTIDIPSFTGCGVGENLNPLFDASVSSNDDFLELVQGPLCTPSTGIGCPPTVPTPQR